MRSTGETEGGESVQSGKGAAEAGAGERTAAEAGAGERGRQRGRRIGDRQERRAGGAGRQRGDTYFFVKDFTVWYLFFNNLCLYSVP